MAEELAAKFEVISLEEFNLFLEKAFDAASVLGFPVSGPLSQFQVFPVQAGDFLTQIRHFFTQLREEVLEVSLAAIAGRNKKYAVHDAKLVAKPRSRGPDEFLVTTGSAKVY